MTDRIHPGQGPGTAGPGPDGAGFTYHGAEPELIVVARAEARLRVGAEGIRSASGADTSALSMFLADEQIALEPLFGREARPAPTPSL
ncbi:serine protease, partial [Streptomyces violascens]